MRNESLVPSLSNSDQRLSTGGIFVNLFGINYGRIQFTSPGFAMIFSCRQADFPEPTVCPQNPG